MGNSNTLRNYFAVLIIIVALYYGSLVYNNITLIKNTMPEYSEMTHYEIFIDFIHIWVSVYTNNN